MHFDDILNCVDADKDDDGLEEGEERDEPKPRALHKTLSIFLRNLPSAVTKQEVEEVCIVYMKLTVHLHCQASFHFSIVAL